jgi:tetratricopeptide (TPR) repeat protein
MRLSLVLLSLMLLPGCFPRNAPLEPNITYLPKARDFACRPSAFSPLTQEERREEWARELIIGQAFAAELDLYRAITSFKRAVVLLPLEQLGRRLQLEYEIALCYFIGERYPEALGAIENGNLSLATAAFPAYRELLLILYECYLQTGQPAKAATAWRKLGELDPSFADQAMLSAALRHGDLPSLRYLEERRPPEGLTDLLGQYRRSAKSVGKAQTLNAVLPGLGYWYVGQRQSAITAALLNGLFIFGTYQLFSRGLWPAGIFTGSLELGWYFGGIYGGGEAAHLYNERLYERIVVPQLCQRRLFPVMMLRFSF